MNNKFKRVMGILLVLFTIIISILIVNFVEIKDDDAVKGNLVIWVEDDIYDYLEKSAKDFMDINAKADIKIFKVSHDEIESSMASANVPDIVELSSSEVRNLAKVYNFIYKNNSERIIDSFSKNYIKSRIDEVKDEDQLLGIPITSRPLVLYLREDMLESYGYTYNQINTWDDLIQVGKDIKEKSAGKVSILNAVDKDYEDLISLIIMQAMEENLAEEEDIKSYVDNTILKLTESGILNTNRNGQFLARISSNNGMYELSNIDQECKWIACNAPAVYIGSNRFYNAEGENLVILKNYDKNYKLIKKFLDYISNNNKVRENYILSGVQFSSFVSSYNNKSIEAEINNFIKNSPVVIMDNIYTKAPLIENYDLYFKIKNQYK